MEITIPWTPVKALLHLAGKTDIREWCNAVWIDRQGPELVIWATNGTVLGALHTEEPSTNGRDVYLPRHIVEACKGFDVQATVKREDDGRMSISCMGTTHYWQTKDFAPADWRRVVPARVTGVAQQFDARLLADFVKVRKALGKKDHAAGVSIAHNNGPTATTLPAGAIVLLRDVPSFVGVLSPIHLDDKGSVFTAVAPEWAGLHSRAASAPAVAEAVDLV